MYWADAVFFMTIGMAIFAFGYTPPSGIPGFKTTTGQFLVRRIGISAVLIGTIALAATLAI